MTERNNREYYVARAEVARALSEAAIDPNIAKIHSEMAERYRELADETGNKIGQGRLRLIQG